MSSYRTIVKGSFFAILCVLIELASCLSLSAQDNRFVVVESGRHGYINQEGMLVIPTTLQGTYVLHFSEGLVGFSERVKPEPAKIPYVDKDGKLRLFPQEKWGFIDTSGAVVIRARFDAVAEFSQGLAAVATDTDRTSHSCMDCDLNQHWGFIDKSGKEVIPLQYHAVSSFSEGLAAVSHCGYVNTSGVVAIPPAFSYCGDFSEDLADVLNSGKWRYIDKQGKVVLEVPYEGVRSFKNGLAAVEEGLSGPDQKFGYIDKHGKQVWKPKPAL